MNRAACPFLASVNVAVQSMTKDSEGVTCMVVAGTATSGGDSSLALAKDAGPLVIRVIGDIEGNFSVLCKSGVTIFSLAVIIGAGATIKGTTSIVVEHGAKVTEKCGLYVHAIAGDCAVCVKEGGTTGDCIVDVGGGTRAGNCSVRMDGTADYCTVYVGGVADSCTVDIGGTANLCAIDVGCGGTAGDCRLLVRDGGGAKVGSLYVGDGATALSCAVCVDSGGTMCDLPLYIDGIVRNGVTLTGCENAAVEMNSSGRPVAF